jgi:hypothetical protein
LPFHLVLPPALADGASVVRGPEVTAGAAALLAVLFPHLAGLEVARVADAGDAVVVFASVKALWRGALAAVSRHRGCTAVTSGCWRTAQPAGGLC